MQKGKSRELLPLNKKCFEKIDVFAKSGVVCSSFMKKQIAIPYTKFFEKVPITQCQKHEVYGTRFVV